MSLPTPFNSAARFVVVTPNYNMQSYLEATVESVLSNLREGDEYFIIDGGSTDGSVDIIKRYEGRISGWVSEKDRGYADALAKGFERSTAEFQCWINCGDLLLPGTLEHARKTLESSNADLIFGDDFYIDEADEVIQVTNGHAANLRAMMLYGGWTPLQDACYWTRDLYRKVGGLDPLQRYAADYDLFLRMSLAGKCRYVPAVFSAFRRHQGQTSMQHDEGYRQERHNCRLRELAALDAPRWRKAMLQIYFWWKVRLRVRLFPRNTKLGHLAGKKIDSLHCLSFDEGRI